MPHDAVARLFFGRAANGRMKRRRLSFNINH